MSEYDDPGLEISEENLEEIVDILDNQDVAEQPLDFNLSMYPQDEGHIYESIEDEISASVEAAMADEIKPDTPWVDVDFDEELPEGFFENDSAGG